MVPEVKEEVKKAALAPVIEKGFDSGKDVLKPMALPESDEEEEVEKKPKKVSRFKRERQNI